VRTTPEGSIDPYRGKPAAGNLKDQLLFTEVGRTLPVL
jgi:adenylylsulfate reductase subunit B